jgi:hypothetical protein
MMPATQTAPAKSLRDALADVDRLQQAAAKWADTETTKAGELEDFESSSARRLVDEPDAAAELTEQAARLRAGLELTRRTRKTAEEQLVAAHREVLVSRAAELRGRAAPLRAEAEQLQQQSDKVLAELNKLQQCVYEPRFDWGSGGMGVQERTKTQRLRSQAEGLENKAAELERQAADMTPAQIGAQAAAIRAIAAQGQAPVA